MLRFMGSNTSRTRLSDLTVLPPAVRASPESHTLDHHLFILLSGQDQYGSSLPYPTQPCDFGAQHRVLDGVMESAQQIITKGFHTSGRVPPTFLLPLPRREARTRPGRGGGAGAAAGRGPDWGPRPSRNKGRRRDKAPRPPGPAAGAKDPGSAGGTSTAASACAVLGSRVGEAAPRSPEAFAGSVEPRQAESGLGAGRAAPSDSLRPRRVAAEPPPELEAAGPGAPRRDGGSPQAQLQGARASGFLCPVTPNRSPPGALAFLSVPLLPQVPPQALLPCPRADRAPLRPHPPPQDSPPRLRF